MRKREREGQGEGGRIASTTECNIALTQNIHQIFFSASKEMICAFQHGTSRSFLSHSLDNVHKGSFRGEIVFISNDQELRHILAPSSLFQMIISIKHIKPMPDTNWRCYRCHSNHLWNTGTGTGGDDRTIRVSN